MDWFATITGIAGAFLNAHDARLATVVWLSSNVAFIAWSLATRNYSILTLNLVYLAINIRTLVVRIKENTK
jgi:hypothetical protein